MVVNESALKDAEILWDHHRLNMEVEPWLNRADGILVFGSHDLRVAERAAELYFQMKEPRFILFTGGSGKVTESLWNRSEASMFFETARRMGVPEEDVILEEQASNTGENIRFSRSLVRDRMMGRKCVLIAVDKPARERRTYAALRKQWNETEFCITSPICSFSECIEYYENGAGGTGVSVADFINIMIGDLERMVRYADQGFQIEMEIPETVENAADRLRLKGFSGK